MPNFTTDQWLQVINIGAPFITLLLGWFGRGFYYVKKSKKGIEFNFINCDIIQRENLLCTTNSAAIYYYETTLLIAINLNNRSNIMKTINNVKCRILNYNDIPATNEELYELIDFVSISPGEIKPIRFNEVINTFKNKPNFTKVSILINYNEDGKELSITKEIEIKNE